MPLVKWTILGLLLLPIAEFITFLVVASLIGWFSAIVLFLATSAVGLWLLRRSGRADLDRLRTAFAQEGLRAVHFETPGFAPMLGGILLVFPGFITDAVGAALLLPQFRRWASATISRAAAKRPQDPSVIDLDPTEWHQVSEKRQKRARKPKRQT